MDSVFSYQSRLWFLLCFVFLSLQTGDGEDTVVMIHTGDFLLCSFAVFFSSFSWLGGFVAKTMVVLHTRDRMLFVVFVVASVDEDADNNDLFRVGGMQELLTMICRRSLLHDKAPVMPIVSQPCVLAKTDVHTMTSSPGAIR